jgi:hypothetical protein
MATVLLVHRQVVDPAEEHLRIDEPMGERFPGELPIPLPPGDALREHQVVRLEAQRDDRLP